METFIQFFKDVGFPTAVAVYSLTRLELAIKANTRVVTIIATKIGLEEELPKEGGV